jgi:MFS family permease
VKDRAFLPMMFVVQFLTWIGMFMLWIFTLPLVANLLGSGEALGSSEAIRWTGYCFALYVTLAALINLALPKVYERIGKGRTHGAALLAGAAGLGSMALVHSPVQLLASFAAVALGWASISSTPYTLVTDRVEDGRYTRAMGIFNFSSVLPQVAVALCMAPLTERLSPASAIAAGGVAMGIAGLLMLIVSWRTLFQNGFEAQVRR